MTAGAAHALRAGGEEVAGGGLEGDGEAGPVIGGARGSQLVFCHRLSAHCGGSGGGLGAWWAQAPVGGHTIWNIGQLLIVLLTYISPELSRSLNLEFLLRILRITINRRIRRMITIITILINMFSNTLESEGFLYNGLS